MPRRVTFLAVSLLLMGLVPISEPAAGAETPPATQPINPVVLENQFLRVIIDARTASLMGIANLRTRTEYIANREVNHPPLIVDAYSANQAVYIRDPFERQSGGFSTFDPLAPAGAKGDLAHLREPLPGTVQVLTERTNAFSRVTCAYRLAGGITVRFSLTVYTNSPTTEWQAWVENRGGEIPANDQRVFQVAFPVLENLRVGDQSESNYLARPYTQ